MCPYKVHHTIIQAAFVCLCVCSLSPPRSFDGSSPNCRWTSHLPLRGSVSKRSTGRQVNGSLSLSTILYMRQPHATQLQKAPFALLLQSLIRRLLLHCISTGNCPVSRKTQMIMIISSLQTGKNALYHNCVGSRDRNKPNSILYFRSEGRQNQTVN